MAVNLFSSKRKRTAAGDFHILPDDCWEYVISKLRNNDGNLCIGNLSLVSKRFLSITNSSVYSFTLIYNTLPLSRLFQRFPNLASLDLSRFYGDLNTLLSRIPCSVSLTSLNLSNHPTFPEFGLRALLKNNKSTLTSLICSNVGYLKCYDMTFIVDSFSFLEELDISFPKGLSGDDYYYNYNNALKVLLTRLSKLRKVNLSGNSYVNDSLFFQLCMNCKFLQEVVMFRCPSITHVVIASAICQRPSLSSLSLTNFKEARERENVTPCFIDSLMSLKRLTCLDLSYSCITDSLLYSLALAALPLRKLVLQGCCQYTYAGISCFLSKCRSLQHLDLQRAKFLNDQRFNKLCAFLGDLVSINVNGCDKLTNSAFFALLRNCPLLTEIRMESTDIGVGSIPSADVVVYHQVKSLRLAHNSGLQDEHIKRFALMFPNMQFLDLCACGYVSEKTISKVLKRGCKIRHLNFAFYPQPKLFLINFEVSKLEVLNLSHSRINDDTLYAISKRCPRLLRLDLEFCPHVTEKVLEMEKVIVTTL